MTKPLALVFYENLLPGSQLVNRLQDLGYRVLTTANAGVLEKQAGQEKPLVLVVDLLSRQGDVCAEIERLRKSPATQHIPVLAFASEKNLPLQQAARSAGATLVASGTAILGQLPELLDQILQVE